MVAARSYHARNREMRLAVLTHNIGILGQNQTYLQSRSDLRRRKGQMFGACLVARRGVIAYNCLMSLTSKFPRRVAAVALYAAQKCVPRYGHRCSPKIYTQPQLIAILVLKTFWASSYKTTETYLHDNPTLQEDLKLKRVPDHSTLHRASRRLFHFDIFRSLLGQVTYLMIGTRRNISTAAIDSTGFEAGQVSPYFVKRKRNKDDLHYETCTYRRFPKCSIIVDIKTHMVLAAWPSRGPTPDVAQLESTLEQLIDGISIKQLLGDAGYDSHNNHELLRDVHGIKSLIPARAGRPGHKPPKSMYRRLMRKLFENIKRTNYGQRWQVETVFSMIKQNLGCAIRERSYWSQNRAMLMKVLTHNVMVCQQNWEPFRRRRSDPV